MNRLLILTFVLLSFLFVTASSKEELVPHKEINPRPLKLTKAGDNKFIALVSWDGNLRNDGNGFFSIFTFHIHNFS